MRLETTATVRRLLAVMTWRDGFCLAAGFLAGVFVVLLGFVYTAGR